MTDMLTTLRRLQWMAARQPRTEEERLETADIERSILNLCNDMERPSLNGMPIPDEVTELVAKTRQWMAEGGPTPEWVRDLLAERYR